METLDELILEANKAIEKISSTSLELFTMGAEYEKNKIFAKLRELIHQKVAENDQTAENVLGWAYEKLAE